MKHQLKLHHTGTWAYVFQCVHCSVFFGGSKFAIRNALTMHVPMVPPLEPVGYCIQRPMGRVAVAEMTPEGFVARGYMSEEGVKFMRERGVI